MPHFQRFRLLSRNSLTRRLQNRVRSGNLHWQEHHKTPKAAF